MLISVSSVENNPFKIKGHFTPLFMKLAQ